MKDMKFRVASRYLRKISKEKSLNLKIDEAFKTWKGTNPITKNEVGYWTVKGWKQLSEGTVNKDKNKAKLQEYAIEVFKSFADHIKGDVKKKKKKKKKKQSPQDIQLAEIQKSIRDMASRPNFGLPKSVFNGNKLGITADAPNREQIENLAEDIKEMFKTPGFQRGAIAQSVAAYGTDEFLKRTVKMLGLPIGSVLGAGAELAGQLGSEKAKSLSERMKETRESNPEVRRMQQNLAIYWTQSSFAVSAGALTTGLTASVGTGIATALATAGAGAVATAASPVISLAVGAIAYKTLLHSREGKVGQLKSKAKSWFKKKTGKSEDLPDSYDNLAANIYTGYGTPEGVEAEYQKKLEDILNDSSLEPADARKKIIELYEDFDTNARPSIDKGLLMLGVADRGEGAGASDITNLFEDTGFKAKDPTTWSSALSAVANKVKKLNKDDLTFLKMGSGLDDLSFLKVYETTYSPVRVANEPKAPVLQQMMQYKDMFDSQEQILEVIEENAEEFGKEFQRVLAGESEIPQEVQDFYKGEYGNEYDSSDKPSKKALFMARRVASLYMRGLG